MKTYINGTGMAQAKIKEFAKGREAAIPMIVEEAMKDSNELIPKSQDGGTLRKSQRTASLPDQGKLITRGPQATTLYFAPENWNWTTYGTGPMWYKKNFINNDTKYRLMIKATIGKEV